MADCRLTALAPGVALLVAALVSACNGESDAAGATGPATGQPAAGAEVLAGGVNPPADLDVCSLLTAEEASELAGEELRAPAGDVYPNGQAICTFGADRFMSYTFVQVSLFVETPAIRSQGFTAEQIFEEQRKANAPVKAIEGIGEAAYRHANSLEVLAGRVTFGVRIAKADPGGMVPVPDADLEAMAGIVFSRLAGSQGQGG